jgi:pimeloyl-ACP methyl ester carboxylesterase
MSTIFGTVPDVVLVHGVGVGPESFARTTAALTDLGCRVHLAVRPGYGDVAEVGKLPVGLDRQVDMVIAELDERKDQSIMWVGVSGGATLGVIAASRRPASIDCAVLHEPLVGSAAADLYAVVAMAARRLATGPHDPDSRATRAAAFMEALVGPVGWNTLGDDGRALVTRRSELIVEEVPIFAAFEADEVPDDDVRVVVTVGERSPDARYEAAERAAELLHGRVVVIPGVGHLPQVEDPDAFAEIIRSCS